MVGKGIPRVYFYFCCTERNSQLCSLPWNGSERNSENLHLFWFHGTVCRVVLSSVERFGTELCEVCFYFYSTERNSELFFLLRKGLEQSSEIFCSAEYPNSVGNNHLFRLFHLPWNYFFVGNSKPYPR
jgi:hypothetical protein